MKLMFLCGLLTLAKAQYFCCNQGTTIATAVSLIKPNSKPPPGIKTQVVGTIKMKQNYGQPTSIYVQLSGLPPKTQHGFHIHEFGDTVTNGCQSTGAHYNPFNYTHGGLNGQIRHVGDLGNLCSDVKGQINKEILHNFVCLCGPYSVFGRAFVVHQRQDDLGRGIGPARAESLRTGNAGARLGCGVIFQGTFQKPSL